MTLGVRTRVTIWLLLVVAIVAGGSWFLLRVAQTQLSQSAEDSLIQLVELERNRFIAELDEQRADAESLAADPDLLRSIDSNVVDRAEVADVLQTLLDKTQSSGQDVEALQLVRRNGALVGSTEGSVWESLSLVSEAMERRSTIVGEASPGSRLGLISPVVSPAGEVLGALVVEADLAPLTWLTGRYESFGDTTEAFVYQRRGNGTCKLITDLRFERSAAFSTVGGDYAIACRAPAESLLYHGSDYRNVRTLSAWSSVPDTDLGVVVKMDEAEAFKVIDTIRSTILIAGSVAAAILLVGWLVLVRSIGSRLARAASAAEKLASGNFDTSINDHRSDEIGRMSQSIGRLANDLAIDIERREMAEARLRIRADYDELTGLMNRARMTARLNELSDDGQLFSVVFLDLDGFKQINDTYGHSTGDAVLQLVASRVQTAVEAAGSECDFARWGGDEFVILCPYVSLEEVDGLVELIDSQFDHPFRTSVGEHRVGVSIGRSDTTEDASIEAVLSAADASMYRMKRRGDGGSKVSPQAIKFVEDALEDDRVLAFLQPFMRVDSGGAAHLIGAEALVRIRNEDGTLANPGSFLPGLGATEQALALDLRVLEQAVVSVAEWLRLELVPADFYVSVNLGASAMADPRLDDKIMACLKRQRLAPRNLVVEIPETARVVDVALIERLRAWGVRIAIDDVGCQFSNLERLVDIPADIAKIDRRWLPNSDPHGASKLQLITGLVQQCQMLDLTVIVEGIETSEQLDLVRGIGIERVQGFLFGRPIEPTHFERLWARPGGQSLRIVATTGAEEVPDETGVDTLRQALR